MLSISRRTAEPLLCKVVRGKLFGTTSRREDRTRRVRSAFVW